MSHKIGRSLSYGFSEASHIEPGGWDLDTLWGILIITLGDNMCSTSVCKCRDFHFYFRNDIRFRERCAELVT